MVKIDEKKPIKKEKNLTFRSFAICCTTDGKIIMSDNKFINLVYLLEILQQNYGLSKSMSYSIQLGDPIKILNIDCEPLSYDGPKVWEFKVNNIKCSLTSKNHQLYIRVHDINPGIGEKIISDLSIELLDYVKFKNPVSNTSLTIYTTKQIMTSFQWNVLCTRLHRDINTIYIDKEVKSKLIDQLTKFYKSSEIYDKYGITWKRVHLFHGPPGSGKTSTILALASIFNKNIAKLTITPHMNAIHIETLFQTLPDNTFLLLEDVDALFTERHAETSIDFSTLLNCMDGLTTKRGLVLFMTTNHIMKLDSAFVRPGRVDFSLEFKLPGQNELLEALRILGEKYSNEHENFLDKYGENMTIATLQKHLFECIMEENITIMNYQKN